MEMQISVMVAAMLLDWFQISAANLFLLLHFQTLGASQHHLYLFKPDPLSPSIQFFKSTPNSIEFSQLQIIETTEKRFERLQDSDVDPHQDPLLRFLLKIERKPELELGQNKNLSFGFLLHLSALFSGKKLFAFLLCICEHMLELIRDIETQRNAPNYHWMTSDKKIGLLPTSSSLTRISSANETLRKSGGRTVFGNPGRKFDLNSSACQTNFASSSFYDRCDNEDATMRKESVLYHGEGSRDESLNNENCINDKNLTLETSTKAHKVTLDSPGSKSRKRSAAIGEKERARKASITKKLESLQHLLPKSGEDNKEVVLDDVIDYVKYLRQQVKPLNHSRLGSEATNDPFIYLEEFGHFLVDQPTMNEPLEEILGQMVEMDMSAVTNMLEAKGLYVMPTSLAEHVCFDCEEAACVEEF